MWGVCAGRTPIVRSRRRRSERPSGAVWAGGSPTASLSAPPVIRIVGISAGIGVAVCLVLIAAWKLSSAVQLWTISDAVAGTMPVLWPASFGLMAIHPGSTTSGVVLVYTILILVNAALYGVIGAVVAGLIRLRRH